MVNNFTSEDLNKLITECAQETGYIPQNWKLIFYRNDTDRESSGKLILQIDCSTAQRGPRYWRRTIRAVDLQSDQNTKIINDNLNASRLAEADLAVKNDFANQLASARADAQAKRHAVHFAKYDLENAEEQAAFAEERYAELQRKTVKEKQDRAEDHQ